MQKHHSTNIPLDQDYFNVIMEEIDGHECIVEFPDLNGFIRLNKNGLFFELKKGKSLEVIPGENDDALSNSVSKIDRFIAANKGLTQEGKGNIYLVTDGQYTKIGATTYNIEKRLNELQVGNAKKLSILGYYSVERRVSTEKMLKDEYSDKHIRGEWFNLAGKDIVKILNERKQSSINSEYQFLTKKQAGQVAVELYRIGFARQLITEKKKVRVFRKYGASDRELEHNLLVSKVLCDIGSHIKKDFNIMNCYSNAIYRLENFKLTEEDERT